MVSVCIHFLILLCSGSLRTNGQIFLLNTKPANDDLILAKTTANLVRKYFIYSSTVSVVEKSLHPELRDYNKDISEYILQNVGDTIAPQLYFGKSENQPWEYNIFIVDSEQAFINSVWHYPKNNFDVEFRFLIVLTNFTTEYLLTIENIFKACKLFRLFDVNILLNHESMGVCMYNYNIVSETECDVVQPYLFFRFSDGIDQLIDIFPRKLQNFYGCPLRICAQLHNPMLTFSGNQSNPKPYKNWNNLNGIDGQLLRILSDSLNFTIDLLPFSEEETYFDNKTAYGCFAKLLSDDADIAIGGFSSSDPYRFGLSLSIFYYHSPIVFVIRGKRELDCVNRLGRPFSIPVWKSIVGLLIAAALFIQVIWMLKPSARQFVFGERNVTPLANCLAAFLGYPVAKIPTQNLARYLLILWLFITLILRNAYQGSLYDSIRNDRFERIPKEYDELFKRNYIFLISNFYSDIDLFSQNQTIVTTADHTQRFKILEKLDGKFATIALRDHVLIYFEENIENGCDLKIIDETVYLFRTAIYFQKHSIYLTAFNDELRKLNYVGILKHIARSNSKESQLFMENNMATPLRPMTNDRIWSLYQMFMLLVGATVAVFALELLTVYFEKLRIIINWLH